MVNTRYHFLMFFTSSQSTHLLTGSNWLWILANKCAGVSWICWYHSLWIQTFGNRLLDVWRAQGAFVLFSKVATLTCPPSMTYHILPKWVLSFDSFWLEMWYPVALTHISLVANEGDPSFSRLLVIWISSFEKNLFILPAHLFIRLLCFWHWVKGALHILGINSLLGE